jgi:hypothetical protein
MATIERKPLPPPNSRAVTISEADRAEMVEHANAVIDYYLNGPGAYWDAGPRKPLVSGDGRGDSTVGDLKRFKDGVIASRQYAEDPNSIIDSIIGLIDRATEQVEQAARNNEGKDDISRRPPEINDPIDDPRVISPRFLNNGVLPIGLDAQPLAPTPPTDESYGTSGQKPIRVLSRRIANQPTSAFAHSAVEEPFSERMATGFDDDQDARVSTSRVMPHNASWSGGVHPLGISNRVMASQPDRVSSLYSSEMRGGLAGRIAALIGNPYRQVLTPRSAELENDGQPQP